MIDCLFTSRPKKAEIECSSMDNKMSWPMGDGEISQKAQWLKKHWSCLLTGIQYDNTALQGDTIDRLTAVYTILTVKSVDAEFGKVEKRLRQSTGESMRRNTHEPQSKFRSANWTNRSLSCNVAIGIIIIIVIPLPVPPSPILPVPNKPHGFRER